jgi:hypothetical protein
MGGTMCPFPYIPLWPAEGQFTLPLKLYNEQSCLSPQYFKKCALFKGMLSTNVAES